MRLVQTHKRCLTRTQPLKAVSVNCRRHSQVVRQRSAKPLFPSSNLGGASISDGRLAVISENGVASVAPFLHYRDGESGRFLRKDRFACKNFNKTILLSLPTPSSQTIPIPSLKFFGVFRAFFSKKALNGVRGRATPKGTGTGDTVAFWKKLRKNFNKLYY